MISKLSTGVTTANLLIEDGRSQFWQWDIGRRLRVVGISEGGEIHYVNNTMSQPFSLKVYTENGKLYCDIPDEMFQTNEKFIAYAYLVKSDGAYTVVEKEFDVKERPKPPDYVYTPTEARQFEDLKKEIEDIMGDVSSALDELHNYAQSLVSGGESE